MSIFIIINIILFPSSYLLYLRKKTFSSLFHFLTLFLLYYLPFLLSLPLSIYKYKSLSIFIIFPPFFIFTSFSLFSSENNNQHCSLERLVETNLSFSLFLFLLLLFFLFLLFLSAQYLKKLHQSHSKIHSNDILVH